jgi:enoyl-[acyl-carrier protein] reductase II
MANFTDLQMDLILKNRAGEITKKDAQFEVERFWMGALRNAVQDGDIDTGSVMAGQSVGLANKIQTLRELYEEMIIDANSALQLATKRLNGTL